MNLPNIFVNLEQSSGLDCTVQDASYNKDGYFPSEIGFYLMKTTRNILCLMYQPIFVSVLQYSLVT